MNERNSRPPASSPCLANELDEEGRMPDAVHVPPEIVDWRQRERERLWAARFAIDAGERRQVAERIAAGLDGLIDADAPSVVSVYWPIRGELNLRPWMQDAHARGLRIVLPVVLLKTRPLSFRRWTPDTRMEPGFWKIPIPADGEELVPDVVIAPLVGFDAACYRLGNGGGYFDRTLATLAPAPLVIGVGHSSARIPSIRPQPHDVPMDVIVTEKDVVRRDRS